MAVGGTVSNAFIQMWSEDVTHLAQQKASKLQGAVRTVRGVVGSQYKFHTLGKGGYTKNKLRNADILPMSDSASFSAPTHGDSYTGGTAAHAVVTATMNSFVTGEYIEDIDQLRTNVDYRQSYQGAIAAALNRAYDNELIATMDAATPGTTVTAGSGLNKAKLIEAAEALNDQSIPMGDNRMLVISPAALTDLLSDTTLVSSDYVANQGLQTGFIPNVMGFNIVVSNLLTNTGASSSRACYAFDRDSIGCAIGKDITSRFDYVPQKVANLVTAEFTQGCAVIDTAGLVQIDVTE
tara:strand:+ start:408 stop:1289 length:882 start_codon:yes stop_codon:yes gene_type:complete